MLENRTEIMQEQTWWKLRCASCLLVFCAVVWYCLLVTKWAMKKNIQTYPYSNCTFHHQSSQRKQRNCTVPTNFIENFGQHNLLYVSLSAWKRGEKLCKNKHGENCIAQVVCWYFVRLCGAAGVGCEVSEGKKTIQTYPYSNCTFHHQSSQRKQTSFTVPTDLGKTLANIICCMCFFQHNGKQDRTHARTIQLSYSNCWSPLVGVSKNWEQTIGWKDVTFNFMVFVCVALFFGRYTVLAAGSAVLYCTHMQHCTYIICSYSICICCLHILSAVWGLRFLGFFPYSICDLEVFHILSVRPT